MYRKTDSFMSPKKKKKKAVFLLLLVKMEKCQNKGVKIL